MTYVSLLLGLVILTTGAEILVRGASRLAIACRISPLVVGLTIVAFGTSAPELVVCLESTFQGEPEVALGNVVGSNIANVLLILGLAAIITPLTVSQQLVWLDVPIMVVVSLIVGLMSLNGNIGRIEGLLLFGSLIVYNVWVVRKSRSEQKAIEEEYRREFGAPDPAGNTARAMILNLALVVLGLLLLVGGARMFLSSAVEIARNLGVSELVIGLTLVAVGTSLPEIATSVMAAWKGERDIAVGNVVGSNLFNLLGVLGLTAVVAPGGVHVPEEALRLDIPVMILVAIACMPVFFNGHQVARWEGFVFLFYYAAYTAELALSSTSSPLLASFRQFMFQIAFPVTGLMFVAAIWRSAIRRRPQSEHTPSSETGIPSGEPMMSETDSTGPDTTQTHSDNS